MVNTKYFHENQWISHEDFLALCKQWKNTGSDWQKEITQVVDEWENTSNYVEVNTSGSTGNPKIIRLRKSEMVASAKITAETLSLNVGDTVLLCLPARYIAGKMMLIRAWVNEWNIIVTEPKLNPLKELKNTPIHFAAMTPMQVEKCLENSSDEFQKINQIIIGGAPISLQLEEKLNECSNTIFATYGMTETITHVALRQIGNPFYTALKGIYFTVNENHTLCVHASHFETSPFQTNDNVQLINDKQFKWIGRADNVINSGGIKIFPEQLEDKIKHLIKGNFYIHHQANELLGQEVVLVLENPLSADAKTVLLNDIKAVLANFEVPKSIAFKTPFEYTETGKVKRG